MITVELTGQARRTARAMGSHTTVVVVGDVWRHDDWLDDAQRYLTDLELRWSRFLPDSDISRLNAAGGAPVAVDAVTVLLVEHLIGAHHATGGAFDPTLLPSLVALGYGSSMDDPSLRTSLPAGVRSRCAMDGVRLDAARCVVQLDPGTTLDPGGLGKGLAADLVVTRLLAAGATGALVSVGGDLRVGGSPPSGAGWLVAVADPRSDGEVARVHLASGAVATSSTLRRAWDVGESRRHHLLDPTTGEPVTTGLVAATVVAGTAAWAEAWTKAVMVGGAVSTFRRLDELGLGGLAVTSDGTVITNDAWRTVAA